jgi:hypothetical protein
MEGSTTLRCMEIVQINTQWVDFKNTTGTHNESSCKIILSNTRMSDYTINTIFRKGFNGITDIKMGPNVQIVTCISFLILEVIYSE